MSGSSPTEGFYPVSEPSVGAGPTQLTDEELDRLDMHCSTCRCNDDLRSDLWLAERLAAFASGAALPVDHVVWQTVERLRTR